MFGIEALDVVIGMIFIYLLFSLFVTIVNEGINSLFELRGKELQFVIFKMLGPELLKKFYGNSRIRKGTERSPLFFNQKLYEPKDENGDVEALKKNTKKILPSEIDTSTFIDIIQNIAEKELSEIAEDIGLDSTQIETLHDLLKEIALLPKEKIRTALNKKESDYKSLVLRNESIREILLSGIASISGFRNELDKWYEEMMLYLIDWYKRKLRYILLIIGLIISIVFNVDSISIFKTLVNSPEARAAIVQQAESYVASHNVDQQTGLPVPINTSVESVDTILVSGNMGALLFLDAQKANCDDRDSCMDSLKTNYPTLFKLEDSYARLDSLVNNEIANASATLGIGWNSIDHYNWKSDSGWWANFFSMTWHYFKITFGWIITAIALSMGAPFWFDLLRKVVNMKNELKGKGSSSNPERRVVG